MYEGASLWVFIVTITALACTPGADTLYVVTRGIGEGRRLALIAAGGVCLGYVAHALLAAVGVSALIASSPTAFEALRWIGVAYLLYLGLRVLRSKDRFDFTQERPATSTTRAIRQGMLTSVLNPKGLLFFLSVLPQFVGAGSGELTVLLLALLHPAICLVVYGGWALLAGTLGDRLGRNPRFGDILRWISGTILLALGGKLALERR
ncbi:MAG: LysE family translocator [Solirubrobacteraceae bacterium]